MFAYLEKFGDQDSDLIEVARKIKFLTIALLIIIPCITSALFVGICRDHTDGT
jgi:hypothetical protein